MNSESKNMVSVIVPVYNGEQFIRRCLDSILNQSYSDLEVIVVDDGSKDNSGIICDEMAADDARVRVIHQKNGGVNSARKAAVEQASGNWLVFVDADDTLPTTAVEIYSRYFQNNAEILVQGPDNMLISRDDYLRNLLTGEIEPGLCTKAFKKNFFIDHCPVLARNIVMGEDLLINLVVGLYTDHARYIKETLYEVNKGNPDSVTKVFKKDWGYEKMYFELMRNLFLDNCRNLKCYDNLVFLVRKSQLNGIKYIMLDGNKVDYSDEEFIGLESYFADRTDKLGLSEKLIFKVKNDKIYRLIMKTYMRLLKRRKQ